MDYYFLLSVILLTSFQNSSGTRKNTTFYSAVVVEYSPTQDPSVEPTTNILNNVRNFVNLINIASDKFQMDIIVFPEGGLIGYGNQIQNLQIPDPLDRVTLCATNTTYEAPLVQLSCAARAAQAYVVVNLVERFYNSSQQETVYFNTDVVFDSNGTIIARYRKIHLFREHGRSPSPNKELVYFDTDFGVRFGIFTCFDIIFENPGVILANKFNITHFIFPTAWFSQMPFLTAIQEQFYWSYTQDVVLLASGYNEPSVGSSGTGIYLGRLGPATYNMTQTKQTFMLQANVPKNIRSKGVTSEEVGNLDTKTVIFQTKDRDLEGIQSGNGSSDKIKLKQEGFIRRYTTKPIIPPESSMRGFNGSSFFIPFTVKKEVCQNKLCCNFTLDITAVFNQTPTENIRGDDYSKMFYRLAVFDGVRDYDYVDYGGLQTCAIISCVNSDVSSCGLRSDDTTAQTKMIYIFSQSAFIFNSIKISGNFSKIHSSVGPNVLLTGEGSNFGSLLPPQSFTFEESQTAVHGTAERSFQTLSPIPKLITASVYGRLFSRDGQPPPSQSSSDKANYSFMILILIGFISKFFLVVT